MDQALYERVKEFTREQLWEPKGGITPETRLVEDIRIAGLDGKEFIEEYSKEFSVELPGFDWVEYFGPEGVGCLFPFVALFSVIREVCGHESEEDVPNDRKFESKAKSYAVQWGVSSGRFIRCVTVTCR